MFRLTARPRGQSTLLGLPSDALELEEDAGRPRGREAYLGRLGVQRGDKAERPSADEGTMSSAPWAGGDASSAQSDFRQKFLRKLAYNNVWVPQVHRSPKHQTVVIFDWDDTLLCTTWLRKHDMMPDSFDSECPLRKIAQHSKNLLESALKAGHTYIITNAMPGWVEYSAARWAPELLPALRKVPVISARHKFETDFPNDIGQWKIQAFLEVQRSLDATPITNLIALGDADYELEAAQIMGGEFERGLVKTVKFLPAPTPEQHLRQMEIVSQSFQEIVGSVLDLRANLHRRSGGFGGR